MNNKVLLLNYLLNKTIKERDCMDKIFYSSDNYIVFGRKFSGYTYKRRMIDNKLFGFELIIT